MSVPVNDFGLVTVSALYGSGSTSIALTTGHGGKLPSTSGGYQYELTWWNATDYASPADDPNVEIVLVTSRSTDTLTVTRGQSGTAASTKNSSGKTYRMTQAFTKTMLAELRQNRNNHLGLVLQTHRDSDLAQSRVELVTCEQLVMNDGTVSRNDSNEWSGKVAIITTSGAGGLDTGTEQSATWYEVHAITKEDGTRNLLLHKSAGWFVDVGFTTEDASQAIRSASSNQIVAQGVQFNGGKVIYFDAKLEKVGTPTGTIYCTIYSDSAGVPGSSVVTSHKIDVSRLPATPTWIRFTFPRHLMSSLSAIPTRYHFAITGSYSVSGSNYVNWRMDGSAASYTGGSKSTYNGSSWTADTDDDMVFNVGTEQNFSAVVYPTGYTRGCFLGWVYNDSSSDFVPFVQMGRTRRTSRISTGDVLESMSGSTEIIAPNVPPLDMMTIHIGCGGTGTQVAVAAIGDTQSWDISSSSDTTGAQALLISPTSSTKPGNFTDVLMEHGFFIAQGTSNGKIWISGFSW